MLMAVCTTLCAGVNGTTAHSRANCGNNESITWWLFHSFPWKVVSFHYPEANDRSRYHVIDTGYTNTWRQAAVHWGEAGTSRWPIGRWYVYAYHYVWDPIYNREVFDTNTEAVDCNIYDGWWDYS